MTQVEKVARAIWDMERTFPDCGHRPEFDIVNATARTAYMQLALAALRALREPSEGMMEAFNAEYALSDPNETLSPSGIRDGFCAAIDFAIQEALAVAHL